MPMEGENRPAANRGSLKKMRPSDSHQHHFWFSDMGSHVPSSAREPLPFSSAHVYTAGRRYRTVSNVEIIGGGDRF